MELDFPMQVEEFSIAHCLIKSPYEILEYSVDLFDYGYGCSYVHHMVCSYALENMLD